MTGIIILGMLADISVWSALAGTIAACFGSHAFLTVLPLPAVCFGLSALKQNSRAARTCISALAFAALFFPGLALPDYVVLIPACLYAAYTAFKGMYSVSAGRLRENLRMLARALPVPVLVCLFASKGSLITSVCAPCAACALLSSVTVLRMLRHDPDVYLQKLYQLINLLSVAAVCLFSLLLTSRPVLSAAAGIFLTVWLYIVVPVLQLTAYAAAYVFYGFVLLIKAVFPSVSLNPKEPLQLNDLSEMFESSEELQQLQDTARNSPWIFYVILIAAAAAAVFFFFRMMMKSRENRRNTGGADTVRISHEELVRKPLRHSASVRQIRKTYRAFLRYCRDRGMLIRPSLTSSDALTAASLVSSETKAAEQLTGIYQNARYNDHADPEDAKKARELLDAVRRSQRI